MIVVHHLNESRSQRVLWLLEELGVPYRVERHERDRRTLLAPKALREVHPLGKAPVVVDGDLVLAESGAILEELAERHGDGRLVPARGTPEHRRYRAWMHFAEGSAMPPLLVKLIFHQVRTKAPWPVRPLVAAIAGQVDRAFLGPQIETMFGFVDAALGERPWLAGDAFTAADVQMSFPLEAYVDRKVGRPLANVEAFVARIRERPAYRRAVTRGERSG